jgi:nucleoside-diphosphate-sugar epimerase
MLDEAESGGRGVRLLVIGGTRFVGRYIAQQALARGHNLVLFNRGQTNPELFPEATKIRGDRQAGGLDQLAGEAFDAVFDTAPYHPDDVAASAAIAPGVDRYCLVSSISVYRDPVARYADETAPVWVLPGPLPQGFSTPEEYGALKAQCEIKATEMYGDRAFIVRPGLVVGPHDYTDRLTSWLRRLASRHEVIDVRDLAVWMIRAAEERISGVYNAVGPEQPISFADLLTAGVEICRSEPGIVWAGDRFLSEREVALPLWIPRADHAFFELSKGRALAAGLALRPLAQTLADVKAWDDQRSDREEPPLSDTQEDALLAEL